MAQSEQPGGTFINAAKSYDQIKMQTSPKQHLSHCPELSMMFEIIISVPHSCILPIIGHISSHRH